MINPTKNIQKILIVFLLIIFFVLNFNNINYGLPFFTNSDEIAFLISSLSFLTYVTGIEFRVIDPIIAPFLNIFLISNLIFLNEVIINSVSFFEIKDRIYLNPELVIFYGRVSSLIVSTISLYIFYLIFKKLKINFYIYFPIFISLIFSLFLTDVSIVNGKNSYYLLFFLIQLYFLIKFLTKLDKFNLKSYIIFSILASLSWGINYWSSIISIYGVLVLHYQKYKFNNFKYLIIFLLIFLIFGFIPNFFLSSEFENSRGPFSFIFSSDSTQYNSTYEFINLFYKKLILCFKIITFTESIFIIFLIFSFFYLYKNYYSKKNFIIIALLFLEPIILFSISGEVIIQLRYFSGLICLVYLLLAIILQDILIKHEAKKIIILFIMLNILFSYQKFNVRNGIWSLTENNHSFYEFFLANKNINKSTLYVSNEFYFRKNLKNLIFYKTLHEEKLIKTDKFERDNYSSIKKKIKKIKKINSDLIDENKIKKNLNVFETGGLVISDLDNFFEEVKKNYNFIVIDENDKNYKILDYIKKNFIRKNVYKSNDSKIKYFCNLRSIFRFVSEGGKINSDRKIIFGNNYVLYELK
tara:strand:- start:1227 stop:2972 length:1746 start_codon:yes stop_codon:yes gene_type:complete